MNHTVDAITKIGHFIRVKDLNRRQFVSLLEERDGEHSDRGYPKIQTGLSALRFRDGSGWTRLLKHFGA